MISMPISENFRLSEKTHDENEIIRRLAI